MRKNHTIEMLPTSSYELVIEQIERLSIHGYQRLSLPKPLDDSFEHATAAQRAARLWIEGLIAIGLFNAFVIADYFIRGGSSWLPLQVRLCVITPVALILNASMRWNPNKIYRETVIAAASCGIGLTHLYLESDKSAAASAYAQVGLIVAVIFANVVMRLQFPYALTSSAVLMCGDLFFIYQDRFLNPSEKLLGLALAVCAIVMTVIANYSVNREERMAYLIRLRSDMQSRELSSVNAKLQRMSSVDSLTGLANRHAYELEFRRLWREAAASRTSLSAIVIDIDNFKTVNDTRGHLYGDRVLVRVASLLVQGLRGKDDFAARFGGEEFVVLLPSATREGAMIVAERMRKLVEVAGSPALQEPSVHPPLSTVSCGVASCWPSETCNREDLLEAADKALYEAKGSGRNRVCWGELTTPTKKRPASHGWSGRHLARGDSAARVKVQ